MEYTYIPTYIGWRTGNSDRKFRPLYKWVGLIGLHLVSDRMEYYDYRLNHLFSHKQ